jgi:hypothetical protein
MGCPGDDAGRSGPLRSGAMGLMHIATLATTVGTRHGSPRVR